MNKKNLKQRVARRHVGLVLLLGITVVTVAFLVIALKYNVGWLKDITVMFISAFISTILAIYMTKEDILDNDYAEKRDEFGVLTFEKGYREVFNNKDSQIYLKSNDWEQFFYKAKKEKEIYFVGVSFNTFFDDCSLRKTLYELCVEMKYDIYIILANPFDREILRLAEVEEKTELEELGKRILGTYYRFDNDLKKNEYVEAKKRIHIWFSVAFPSTLLIKAGKYMIVSPYVFENPDKTPTLIVEDSKAHSFYEKYDNYLKVIKKHHYTFTELRRTVTTKEFFKESYTSLSPEFYDDLKNCEYIAIIGLGQSRMLRTIGSYYEKLLKKGIDIDVILTDPDKESTKMCTRRSSKNRNDISGDISVHKESINRLLEMKKYGNIKIYVSDFMYPYTMYAFNCKNGVNDRTKMYIWQTVLFEASDKRPGFLCEGKEDFEIMSSYYRQFRELRDNCASTREITCKYSE